MTVKVTGYRELDGKLSRMRKSVQRKIIKKAMKSGAKIVAMAIKRELPNSWKGAKRTIGFSSTRIGRGKFKGVSFAKAGAGVGMKKKRRMAAAAKSKLKGRGNRKGVGIGVSNIMWFMKGTDPRYTGTKRVGAHRRGVKNRRVDTGGIKRYTGRLKKSGIVQRAYRASKGPAKSVIAGELIAGIMREAKKR